jgi:malonate-semialdehyde dehydrogenase (acetylating)/methylmalonate-semialdehyde dehydrogenase
VRTIEHWIGGSLTAGASTRYGPAYNPATGARVVLATREDVDTAVAVAVKAFEQWGRVLHPSEGNHVPLAAR